MGKKLSKVMLIAAIIGLTGDTLATEQETAVSTQIFTNLSNIQQNPVNSSAEGWQFDLKRFYINVDQKFNNNWKGFITTDVQWRRQADPTDVWFRHAYVERQFGDQMTLWLGVAPLPWIDYVARKVGYRYIDPSINPMQGFAGPTDLGVHFYQTGERFSYGVSVVTGGGFKKPTVGDSADVETYAAWHLTSAWDIAVGYYSGARAQDKDESQKFNSAERFNGSVNYQTAQWRFGVEYVYASNWNQVATPVEDAKSGWGSWVSYRYAPAYSVFLRYDSSKPSRRLNPTLEKDYIQAGWDWQTTPYLTVAVVAKHKQQNSATNDKDTNEVGVWTLWNF
ncbi:MAG: hypothetical protein ACQEQZ_07850 [Pseudomonadota bacterium]